MQVRGQAGEGATNPMILAVTCSLLARRLDEIPKDRPLVVHCAGGYRSSTVASLLQRAGIDASELTGGIAAWESGRPT